MKALVWRGVNQLAVTQVPDPELRNEQDMIVRVRRSATCGADLHLLGGHLPLLRRGDVLGHEFLGEVVEVGPRVRRHRAGDRVVVCSVVSCGRCGPCRRRQFSLCDNGGAGPALGEPAGVLSPGGCYGSSPALGGFAGSHAEYARVPYADQGAFTVPDGVTDERALFASDAAPSGWMAADLGGVRPGDVVAVWGAGAVGQLAARAAVVLGAERVVVIDPLTDRLRMAERHLGVETLDPGTQDVGGELRERSGGRGPDVCIDAAGAAAPGGGRWGRSARLGQRLRPGPDRSAAAREAVYHCREGGNVFLLGTYARAVDRFPLGAVVTRGLTLRGARQHGHRYIPMLLDRMARGELVTEHLATHPMPLDRAPLGYDTFRNRLDGCVRAVFEPGP
ncbi:alcohol dehydrogenase catalytic domain-containing protein [Micromonospora sp. AMSO31t]|uniref:alcohol dehydrogenase catalytic domain-containing protein n=1 Tax=Micromonospora sp. AMSO31t TaxID=2650566 RepID=UPI00124BB0C1|nr:alcohol dehydrogenase catalytic domain-containing protein [Micromonospora sp. AMSO31t]KAB1910593.1 alcohol dehydrogenase catalytic domain-containing protein [Micromonospora sp. AMSO31t]